MLGGGRRHAPLHRSQLASGLLERDVRAFRVGFPLGGLLLEPAKLDGQPALLGAAVEHAIRAAEGNGDRADDCRAVPGHGERAR